MSQTHTISRSNTAVIQNSDGSQSVILHSTEVIRHNPAKRSAVFNTGGWFTATTRTRMNQACNQWGLPLSVSFAEDKPIVRNHVTGAVYPFKGDVCKVSY